VPKVEGQVLGALEARMRESVCGGRLEIQVKEDISVGTGGRGNGSVSATGTAGCTECYWRDQRL